MQTQTNPDTGREERVLCYIGKHYTVDQRLIRRRRLPMLLLLLAHCALILNSSHFVSVLSSRSSAIILYKT